MFALTICLIPLSLLPVYYPQFGLWPCDRRTWSPWRASGWTRSSTAAAATSSPWSVSRATSSQWPRSTPASTAGPRGCSTGRFLYLTTTSPAAAGTSPRSPWRTSCSSPSTSSTGDWQLLDTTCLDSRLELQTEVHEDFTITEKA